MDTYYIYFIVCFVCFVISILGALWRRSLKNQNEQEARARAAELGIVYSGQIGVHSGPIRPTSTVPRPYAPVYIVAVPYRAEPDDLPPTYEEVIANPQSRSNNPS